MSIQEEIDERIDDAIAEAIRKLDLEIACNAHDTNKSNWWYCHDGRRIDSKYADTGSCPSCGGTGLMIGPRGSGLLDFLARHWGELERRRAEIAEKEGKA